MSHLWKWCKKNTNVFLIMNTLVFALLGAAVWGFVSIFALRGVSWLFCFAGYGGFAPGFCGGIFFMWKHAGEEET